MTIVLHYGVLSNLLIYFRLNGVYCFFILLVDLLGVLVVVLELWLWFVGFACLFIDFAIVCVGFCFEFSLFVGAVCLNGLCLICLDVVGGGGFMLFSCRMFVLRVYAVFLIAGLLWCGLRLIVFGWCA